MRTQTTKAAQTAQTAQAAQKMLPSTATSFQYIPLSSFPRFVFLPERFSLFTIIEARGCAHSKPTFFHARFVLTASLYVQLDCQSARRTRKIDLPTNQKGYDNSETIVGKLSTRKIQIYPFCVVIFWTFNFETKENRVLTKIVRTESDSPHQILWFPCLRFFWGASDQWQLIFLATWGTQADSRMLNNIVLAHISDSLVRKNNS